jgi:hypothetical protein
MEIHDDTEKLILVRGTILGKTWWVEVEILVFITKKLIDLLKLSTQTCLCWVTSMRELTICLKRFNNFNQLGKGARVVGTSGAESSGNFNQECRATLWLAQEATKSRYQYPNSKTSYNKAPSKNPIPKYSSNTRGKIIL